MGKYGAAAGVTSTELLALTASQVNVSSIGDTYTDTAGDTYAETASQTRVTLSAARPRSVIQVVSAHVSAGTGTIQLWNFTDSASLATATTTATAEALLTQQRSVVATNNGDAITNRVKNSGAGGTFVVDGGGIAEGDYNRNITGLTFNNITTTGIDPLFSGSTASSGVDMGGWLADISIAILKTPSTGTLTATVGLGGTLLVDGTGNTNLESAGAAFGTAEANTVITRTPTRKSMIYVIDRTAIGASNKWGFSFSFQVKADDI